MGFLYLCILSFWCMVTRVVIEACMAHRHVKLQRKKRWNGVLCTKKHFIPQTKDPSLSLFETQEPHRICNLQTGLNTKFGKCVKWPILKTRIASWLVNLSPKPPSHISNVTWVKSVFLNAQWVWHAPCINELFRYLWRRRRALADSGHTLNKAFCHSSPNLLLSPLRCSKLQREQERKIETGKIAEVVQNKHKPQTQHAGTCHSGQTSKSPLKLLHT